jgi:hypothetical protein
MALRYNRYTVSFLQHHHGSSSIAWYVSGDSTVIFGSPTEEDNTQEELFDSLMDGGGVDFCEGRGLHFLSLIKAELQYRMTTKEEENQRALMGTIKTSREVTMSSRGLLKSEQASDARQWFALSIVNFRNGMLCFGISLASFLHFQIMIR